MILKELQSLVQNKIILKKKKYTVIIGADPSKTARSPILWNYFFKKTNQNIEMIPLDTDKKNIKKILEILSKDNKFLGGCVAVPFKENIYHELLKKKALDKITQKIGAVNCIYKNKNKIFGTNTDGEAAIKVFNNKFGNIRNKKCLILGYGGVGKAVTAFFNNATKRKIIISNRTKINKNIISKNNLEFIEWKKFPTILSKMDIIINCTSLGFDKNRKSPLKKKEFYFIKNNVYLFDVIYNPLETTFLKLGKKRSRNFLNGLEMNKMQAILAIKKVLKNKFSANIIKRKLEKF